MSYRFDASHVFAQDDGYMVMIGFADDEHEPSQFVLLQKAKEYDEQDKRLGMDKIHIQVEDESRALYGGIRLISKEGEHLLIELEDAAASALRVNGNIEINLDPHHPQLATALAELEKLVSSEGIPFNQNG
jgi:hypothetical protein